MLLIGQVFGALVVLVFLYLMVYSIVMGLRDKTDYTGQYHSSNDADTEHYLTVDKD